MDRFDKMTYPERVEFFFQNDDRKSQLSDDCFCRVIGDRTTKTRYTMTVDTRPEETEISIRTYEHADEKEETEAKLDDVLEEYGKHEWNELPVKITGCAFCPSRYECDLVRQEVEEWWHMFID